MLGLKQLDDDNFRTTKWLASREARSHCAKFEAAFSLDTLISLTHTILRYTLYAVR